MAKANGLTVGEVIAFTERVKAALLGAEADRRTVAALRQLVSGGGGSRGAGGLGRPTLASLRGGSPLRGAANDGRILELVRAKKDGVAAGDLIRTLRMNRKALNRALRRLRAGGKVKMTGKKRLARYFAT